MFRLLITGPAKRDIQAAHDWWAENRSSLEAHKWYRGIHQAIQSLRRDPERCSFATEPVMQSLGIRQLLFGIRRKTHRTLFTVDEQTIVVLRIRHTAQQLLEPEDLA